MCQQAVNALNILNIIVLKWSLRNLGSRVVRQQREMTCLEIIHIIISTVCQLFYYFLFIIFMDWLWSSNHAAASSDVSWFYFFLSCLFF